MSAAKLYSEREKAEAQRVAFVAGSTWDTRAWQKMLNVDHCTGQDEIAESRRRYPLPKVMRPRVVTLRPCGSGTALEYAFVGDRVVCRSVGSREWKNVSLGLSDYDAAFLVAIGTLATNPTELVDDDGSGA